MPISHEERQRIISQLKAGEARFAAALERLSAEQLNFRESPERWSIAENVEHVIRVERRVLGRIADALGQPIATPVAPAPKTDTEVGNSVLDRSSRFQAPEPARPTGEWNTFPALREAFAAARSKTLEFASTTACELRDLRLPHPVFGEMDAYQWLIAIANHPERHLAQIAEIKGNAAYPAS